MTNEPTPKLIKFNDGTMVVAMLEDTEDYKDLNYLKILYPIEVVTDTHTENSIMNESYTLKPWMGLSDDVLFDIRTSEILTISELRIDYHEGYDRMVDRMYAAPESSEHKELDFGPEDLLELLQARESNDIN